MDFQSHQNFGNLETGFFYELKQDAMISKILDNLTWISIFMIVGGVMMAIVGSTGEQIGVDFWGIKVNSSNGGVALAIVGGLLMLKPAMAALKNNGNITTENGLLYLTVIIEDKETARGIANAEILVDFLEGKKTFHTDRDGTAHLSFTAQNKLSLKSTTLSVSANGYGTLTNKKLDLEAGEVKKFRLSKAEATSPSISQPKNQNIDISDIKRVLMNGSISELDSALRNLLPQLAESKQLELSNLIKTGTTRRPNNFNETNWREDILVFLNGLNQG